MFELFTEKAIRVIMIAQEESRRMGHNFVGSEQILLGLLGEGSGLAYEVLISCGVKLKEIRIQIEKLVGRGSGFVAVEIPFTPRAKRVLETSLWQARDMGHNYIGTEHLLIALLIEDNDDSIENLLALFGANKTMVRTQLYKAMGEDARIPFIKKSKKSDSESDESSTYTECDCAGAPIDSDSEDDGLMFDTDPPLSLEEYTTNLSEAAAKRKLDPVIGREKEIERVIQILARRSKNNPVLIGEPGVGKTAVAEGLALKIYEKAVPSDLEDKQIVCLDIGLLLAGTKYRGEFEERIKRIVEEVEEVKTIILVIDEVHTIIGAGAAEGAVDAANILKPALARGQFQCIGATTIEEYRKYIEKDPALERRFQPVYVDEPSVEDTIEILRGIRQYYEHHHRLQISDEAIECAAKYAAQYITDRFLPDKAIDLIDEASSRVRLKRGYKLPDVIDTLYKEATDYYDKKTEASRTDKFESAIQARDKEMEVRAQIRAIIETNKKFSDQYSELLEPPSVQADDIGSIVASWTGIPITKISQSETEKLVNMESILHQRIIGQHQAVTAIAKAIRRARTGLKNPNRPIASFIFSGPTGVGKTELTKTLSSYYFGAEDAMIRLDMSEFMERHTVAKLIGSPPGYVGFSEGGQLTEAVRRKPYSLVLFDEIEKAHPDVFNLLLQILEDGRLTDSKGRTIDFKNTVIIMTSNLGSKVIEKYTPSDSVGFNSSLTDDDGYFHDSSYSEMSAMVQKELKNHFRPEFLNRIDEIIVFQQLTKHQVAEISELMINDVIKRVKEAGYKNLTVTERMKKKLVDEGYNPTYGARPLRRAVTRLLEDSLAKRILDNGESNPKLSEIWADIDEYGKPSISVDTVKAPEIETTDNLVEATQQEVLEDVFDGQKDKSAMDTPDLQGWDKILKDLGIDIVIEV
jgi:ATP-dependent Clp protease ATP-binding subunit ClpC